MTSSRGPSSPRPSSRRNSSLSKAGVSSNCPRSQGYAFRMWRPKLQSCTVASTRTRNCSWGASTSIDKVWDGTLPVRALELRAENQVGRPPENLPQEAWAGINLEEGMIHLRNQLHEQWHAQLFRPRIPFRQAKQIPWRTIKDNCGKDKQCVCVP